MRKMLGMGIRSLSAYIRKMALDGYCLHLDLPATAGAWRIFCRCAATT